MVVNSLALPCPARLARLMIDRHADLQYRASGRVALNGSPQTLQVRISTFRGRYFLPPCIGATPLGEGWVLNVTQFIAEDCVTRK